jgi:hypothetical protein
VDSELSVNVSAQTGNRANVYFAHRIHLRRETFNKERKNTQRKQTNKEEKKTSFHTVWCVPAVKASMLLQSTPVSQMNTLHYGAQLLRSLFSFITVIEIIRNHWFNTQRPDIMETYYHHGRFKTITVYAACIGPRNTGNSQNYSIIKATRCTNFSKFILEMKLCMFRTVPLSVIRSYSLYTQQWYTRMSHRFPWNILILLDSCLQTCVTYTIAECTVNNSWWWTEELSETCTVSFPK